MVSAEEKEARGNLISPMQYTITITLTVFFYKIRLSLSTSVCAFSPSCALHACRRYEARRERQKPGTEVKSDCVLPDACAGN